MGSGNVQSDSNLHFQHELNVYITCTLFPWLLDE